MFCPSWKFWRRSVDTVKVEEDSDSKVLEDVADDEKSFTSAKSAEIYTPPPTLFEEIKPLACVMFMNQLWPVQALDNGQVEACIFNVAGVATLLMYTALVPFHIILLVQSFNLCWEVRKNYAALVFYLTYPAICHHHVLTPLIAWLPAPSLAQYFNAWTLFQAEWYHHLGRPLKLSGMRGRAIRTALRGVLSPLFITTVCFLLIDSLRFTQFPTFIMSSGFLLLRSASWIDLCAAHENAALQLQQILIDTLNKHTSEAREDLRRVRAVWYSLQSLSPKLASGLGAIPPLHYTCCLLAVSILTSVGVLMAVLSSNATPVTGAQLVVAMNNLLHVAKMHQGGHRASLAIKNAIVNPLLRSTLTDDLDRNEEILSFLLTLDNNSGGITIGDFMNCSRPALVTFHATFVTYIVVLVQFAYTLSSEG